MKIQLTCIELTTRIREKNMLFMLLGTNNCNNVHSITIWQKTIENQRHASTLYFPLKLKSEYFDLIIMDMML